VTQVVTDSAKAGQGISGLLVRVNKFSLATWREAVAYDASAVKNTMGIKFVTINVRA
jgi:hypothetical protein